ncbi:MAG: hypothetical protein AB1483_06310 [Candidatus Zixiibacteriota bacterium]
MRDMKWYYWVAFILGGLAAIAIVYVVLRSSGVLNKLMPDKKKMVEDAQ